jgi:hypothetical protein
MRGTGAHVSETIRRRAAISRSSEAMVSPKRAAYAGTRLEHSAHVGRIIDAR